MIKTQNPFTSGERGCGTIPPPCVFVVWSDGVDPYFKNFQKCFVRRGTRGPFAQLEEGLRVGAALGSAQITD